LEGFGGKLQERVYSADVVCSQVESVLSKPQWRYVWR
jgi:hypothetical protein